MATPLPKCCFEAKTSVPYEMRQELQADAEMAGCDFAEMLRDVIYMHKRGMTYGEHVANHRRTLLFNKAVSNVGNKASK